MPLDQANGTETDPIAKDIIDRWRMLKADRSHYEGDWEEIDRLMSLHEAGSYTASDIGGRQRREKPLSSTPAMALQNFASGLYGALISPTTRWMGLVASDPELRGWKPMLDWQEQVTDRVLASFRPAVSPFYTAAQQVMTELAGKGNAVQYDEEMPGRGQIMDMTMSLAEIVWEIDGLGRVTGMIRMFRLTARQAVIMFGADNLPKKMAEKADKSSDHRFVFYHSVRKNEKMDISGLGTPTMPYVSIYVAEEGKHVARMRGYREMPFYAARLNVWPGQTYGMGYGHTALPASRVLNLMRAANLRAGQKAADPTLMAPNREDWPLEGDIRPGQMIYGAVDAQGRSLINPLRNYEGTGLTLEMENSLGEEVRESFLYTLMNLQGRTGMTATEVLQITADRLALMAPHMGRVQEEYLAPKVARRVAMLQRAGQLPPPPEGLPKGATLEVQYQSAAAMAQRAQEGATTARFAEQMMNMAQFNPRFADRIDADGVTEVLLEAGGVPARVLVSREQADEISQARNEQQQMQQLMEVAKDGATVAKDLKIPMPGSEMAEAA